MCAEVQRKSVKKSGREAGAIARTGRRHQIGDLPAIDFIQSQKEKYFLASYDAILLIVAQKRN